MKRAMFLFVVILFSASVWTFASGQGKICIQIQAPTTQVVLGEPLSCMVIWENRGESPMAIAYATNFLSPIVKLKLQGPIKKECIVGGFIGEWQVGAHVIIPPDEKSVCTFRPMDFGAVGIGDYEMWVEYDGTALEPFWDSYGVNRSRVDSNHIRFSIVPPVVSDAAFFSRHTNQCNQLTMTSEEVLCRYPASIYAVYALAEFYGLKGYTPPLDEERVRIHLAKLQKTGREELADRTRHFAMGPDGKELKDAQGKVITITQEEWLRKSIEQAEQIYAGHPELSITEHIRYNVIGFYWVDLLKYGEACKVFEKLAATATDPQIKANSERMIQLLKEAGVVPN